MQESKQLPTKDSIPLMSPISFKMHEFCILCHNIFMFVLIQKQCSVPTWGEGNQCLRKSLPWSEQHSTEGSPPFISLVIHSTSVHPGLLIPEMGVSPPHAQGTRKLTVNQTGCGPV